LAYALPAPGNDDGNIVVGLDYSPVEKGLSQLEKRFESFGRSAGNTFEGEFRRVYEVMERFGQDMVSQFEKSFSIIERRFKTFQPKLSVNTYEGEFYRIYENLEQISDRFSKKSSDSILLIEQKLDKFGNYVDKSFSQYWVNLYDKYDGVLTRIEARQEKAAKATNKASKDMADMMEEELKQIGNATEDVGKKTEGTTKKLGDWAKKYDDIEANAKRVAMQNAADEKARQAAAKTREKYLAKQKKFEEELAKINEDAARKTKERWDAVATSIADAFKFSISTIMGFFTGLVTSVIAGGKRILSELSNQVDQTGNVFNKYQAFLASMTAIKGSSKAAAEEYEFLLNVSNKLGTSVENSITQYHRLAASLKNVDKTGEMTRNMFVALSEAQLVLHSTGQQAEYILEAFVQMAGKGKLSLEELQRQLGNSLPGAVATGAKAMMNTQEYIEKGIDTVAKAEKYLREQIQKGTINVYQFISEYANQLKRDYGGSIDYLSGLWQAYVNRLKNIGFEFYRVLGTSGMMEGLAELYAEFVRLLSEADSWAQALGSIVGDAFRELAKWFKSLDTKDVTAAFQVVLYYANLLKAGLITFANYVKEWSNSTKTPILDFTESTVIAFSTAYDTVVKIGKAIILVFAGIGEGIAKVINYINRARLFIAETELSLSKTGKAMFNFFGFGTGAHDKAIADSEEEVRKLGASVKWSTDLVNSFSKAIDFSLSETKEVGSSALRLINSLRTGMKGATAETIRQTESLEKYFKLHETFVGESAAPVVAKKTSTTSGGRTSSTTKQQTDELAALTRAYDESLRKVEMWEGKVSKADEAERKIKQATHDLTEAVLRGVISWDDYQRILGDVTKKLSETPLDKTIQKLENTNQAIAQQIAMMESGMSSTQIEAQLAKTAALNEMKQAGYDITSEEVQAQADKVAGLTEEIAGQKERLAILKQAEQFAKKYETAQKQALANIDAVAKRFEQTGNSGERDALALDLFKDFDFSLTDQWYNAMVFKYNQMQEQIQRARDKGVLSEEAAQMAMLQNTVKMYEQRVQAITNVFNGFTSLMQSSNETAFRIGKAAAIAEATVQGYVAIMKAYASAPPPYSYIAAAAMTAKVAMQIASIARQEMPSYQLGGDFRVGGAGGADSQLVQFMATPGERVSVQTPQQQSDNSNSQSGSGVRILNVIDPEMVNDYMATPSGERTVVNVIQRNRGQLKSILA